MIEIKTERGSLGLYPDTTIQFELINPLFSDVVGYNSFVFSLQIPNDGRNVGVFEMPDEPTIIPRNDTLAATILFDGVELFEATIKVEDANDRVINIGISVMEAKLAQELDRELTEFNLGGEISLSNQSGYNGTEEVIQVMNEAANGMGDWPFTCFPYKNVSHYPELVHPTTPTNWEYEIINLWDQSGTFSQEEHAHRSGINVERYTVSPQFFLLYIIRELLQELGYELVPSAWTEDPEIQSVVVWNNRTLQDEQYSDNLGSMVMIYMYHYRTVIKAAEHVPPMKAKEFLSSICKVFNLSLFCEGAQISIRNREEVVLEAEELDWRDKVTHISVVADSSENKDGFEFKIDRDENDELSKPELDKRPTTVGEVNFPHELPLSSTMDSYLVRETNEIYSYGDQGWEPVTWDQFTMGEGELKVTTKASTTRMKVLPWGGGDWRIPAVDMPGSSEGIAGMQHPFGLRLLFYRGIYADIPNGVAYPHADASPVRGIYNYSLHWEGERGLYKSWWEGWHNVQSKQIIRGSVRINIMDIKTPPWEKKVRMRTSIGEIGVFVKRLNVSLSMSGILPAEGEFMSL